MLGLDIESQIKDTMVEAIEKYAKKYEIADLKKLHIQLSFKEPENETDSPICYKILDAANNSKVLETTIVQEILGLKHKGNGVYRDLFKKTEICTLYIFAAMTRYCKEYNLPEEKISINVVHNGKLKREANVGMFLVNGTDYSIEANATMVARLKIDDFVGEKTFAVIEQIKKEGEEYMKQNGN